MQYVNTYDFLHEHCKGRQNNADCKAYEGAHPEPTTTIISPKNVWMDLSMGKIDGAQALMDGQYKVEGDMTLLMKMNKLFRRK